MKKFIYLFILLGGLLQAQDFPLKSATVVPTYEKSKTEWGSKWTYETKNIVEYKLVAAWVANDSKKTSDALSNQINDLIKKGWVPFGPAFVSNTTVYQTLVRYQ